MSVSTDAPEHGPDRASTALDRVLLDVLGIAYDLEETGVTKRNAAKTLRAVVHRYEQATGWSEEDARERDLKRYARKK